MLNSDWIKQMADYLAWHPLPVIDILADMKRERARLREQEAGEGTRTQQDRPAVKLHEIPRSPKSTSKLASAGQALSQLNDVRLESRRLSPSEENREIHNRKMITSVARQKTMRKKPQKTQDIEVPNPLQVNEAEFTDVIRKMVNTEPVERKEVEGGFRYRREKNPHEGPLFPPTKDSA